MESAADQGQNQGIDHHGEEIIPDLFCALEVLGQTGENRFQEPPRLPCLDHIDVEPAERSGGTGQCVSQGASSLDPLQNILHGLSQSPVFRERAQDTQAPVHGQPGGNERGELLGEDEQVFDSRPAGAGKRKAGSFPLLSGREIRMGIYPS